MLQLSGVFRGENGGGLDWYYELGRGFSRCEELVEFAGRTERGWSHGRAEGLPGA